MKSTRKPLSKKKIKQNKKSAQVFKTALPLAITTVLLGLIYVLVLIPVKPENILKSAFYNTFDTTKQKSGRFDGTIGSEENDIQVEFNGQKSNNGDVSSSVKLSQHDSKISLEGTRVANDTYVKITGVEYIPTVLKSIPGAKPLDSNFNTILSMANGRWVKVSSSESQIATKNMTCGQEIGNLFAKKPAKSEKDDFPFELSGGPYKADDGTTSQTFEVKLKPTREITVAEQNITQLIECVDTLRSDDYRLRQVHSSDIDGIRLRITVDPLSNTITYISYKQFGNYFQLFLRDLNKDVSVTAPDNTISITEIIKALPPETQLELLSGI